MAAARSPFTRLTGSRRASGLRLLAKRSDVGKWRIYAQSSAIAAACLFLVSACAPEEQTEYTQDTNTNFFAACSDAVTDTQLHVELCQCVYRRLEVTIPYQKLKVLDEELVADVEAPLQPEFVAIMATCIVETLEQLS